MKWNKVRDRKVAGNVSIMYDQGPLSLETWRAM
jgi:hypothetical protein